MATDWAADVKKYVANANDAAIAGIVRYCGIALYKRDSSLVSFSDSKETDRVRNNFLRKKLALTDSDAVLDAAIAKVGNTMKADRTKNRVTVYYLLADHFGKLGLFIKPGATKAAAPVAAKAPAKKAPAKKAPAKKATTAKASATKATTTRAAAPKARTKKATTKKITTKKAPAKKASLGKAAVAGGAAVGLASLSGAGTGGKAAANDGGGTRGATAALGAAGAAVTGAAGAAGKAGTAAVGAAGAAAAGAAGLAAAGAGRVSGAATGLMGGGDSDESGGGWNWLLWLLLGLLALWLLWYLLFGRGNNPSDVEAVDLAPTTEAAANASPGSAVDLAAAPAEGSVTIPNGAGVTSEMRDGKPVVKVYFDSGRTDVVPDFAATAGGLKAWLEANSGSSLAISGFNDPSGSAARNAELAKGRAEAVQAALVAAGVPQASTELVPPAAATDTGTNPASARRVEVVVR